MRSTTEPRPGPGEDITEAARVLGDAASQAHLYPRLTADLAARPSIDDTLVTTRAGQKFSPRPLPWLPITCTYLWRCRPGRECLGHPVTSRRDAKAATRFFRKLLRGLRYVPRMVVTDKLRSTGPRTVW
jgi:hypothetical protein